jgi:hypothetical protein
MYRKKIPGYSFIIFRVIYFRIIPVLSSGVEDEEKKLIYS